MVLVFLIIESLVGALYFWFEKILGKKHKFSRIVALLSFIISYEHVNRGKMPRIKCIN